MKLTQGHLKPLGEGRLKGITNWMLIDNIDLYDWTYLQNTKYTKYTKYNTAIELLVLLAQSNHVFVSEALAKNKVSSLMLDFLCDYEWNNFLHKSIEQYVMAALKGDSNELKRSVMNEHLLKIETKMKTKNEKQKW